MANLRESVQYPAGYAERWLREGVWAAERPFEWLAKWAAEIPDHPAIVGPGVEVSYAEFNDGVLRCAAGFDAAGIRGGDTVGLQLPNVPEILIAWHALHRLGAVPTLLHMPYREGELAPLMNHGGVKAVVCWNGMRNYDAPTTMSALRQRVSSLGEIYVLGGDAPPGTVAFDELLAHAPRAIAKPSADAPCLLAFTSGTSAAPKAVVHPFHTLAATHRAMSARCGLSQEDRVLSAPPFTHAYGICVAGLTLHGGATAVLMPSFTPSAFAEALTEHRATITFCAPAHFLGALHTGALTEEVTQWLRMAVLAGSACPPEVFAQMEATFKNAAICQMFGMTEVLMTLMNPLDAARELRMTSIGTSVGGHEIRICEPEEGRVLPADEEGELEFRGPFLFAGYFGNEAANQSAFREDGWFRTGDLAKMDADGNVYMTGRQKDIINRGGIKINPLDIEAMVDDHDKVFLSAIVPMPDPILGERACLFVQLRLGESLTLDEVCAHLAEQGVAKVKWPERLETVDAMPMTPTRKIIKSKLVEVLQERLAFSTAGN